MSRHFYQPKIEIFSKKLIKENEILRGYFLLVFFLVSREKSNCEKNATIIATKISKYYKFTETDQYSPVETFELLRYGVETCNIPMIDFKLRIGMYNILLKNGARDKKFFADG